MLVHSVHQSVRHCTLGVGGGGGVVVLTVTITVYSTTSLQVLVYRKLPPGASHEIFSEHYNIAVVRYFSS